MTIGLLVSGILGLNVIKQIQNRESITFVFTDKSSSSIIELCKNSKIPTFVGNPRKSKREVVKFLEDKPVDIIFSINYLFIVEDELLNHPNLYSINFHGSLLPKYRGRTPHIWAIINGEEETGVTAHLMNEKCDTGDIAKQVKVEIDAYDKGADILNKFINIYPIIIDNLIKDIKDNSLKFIEQDNAKATYFGRRTPEDGEINWDWQKERIRNWVRAQSYPYPGAFTFYWGQKIVIDKVEYSDLGYSYDISNGTILKVDSVPYVKTPNGVLKITEIRDHQTFKFEANKKFE